MHPNPAFHSDDTETSLAFAATRGFGTISINGPDGPLIAQVPFILSPDGSFASFHFARANALARKGNGMGAVLHVNGPDGYISPDWYGVDDMVPTWNYVSVEIRGTLEILPPDALIPHLRALSQEFESRLAPKPVWLIDKVSKPVLAKMTRMIVPARLVINSIQATNKLGQNKPDKAQMGAAKGLANSAVGQGTSTLAQMMAGTRSDSDDVN